MVAQHSFYKNKQSLVLETSKLRAEFIPEPGGKLVSLINKETGYEFMVQRKTEIYKDEPFAGVYVNGECSGFDDMFPTIDVCIQNGVEMADHGEVWSLPWEVKEESNAVQMRVSGVRFPYLLEKEIHLIGADTLRIDYTLTNKSASAFEFLWAGHLMINVEEGSRLLVPEDCKQMVTILTNGKGKFGDVHEWPYLENKDGELYRADIVRSANEKGFEKYYFSNKLKNGWTQLQYPDPKNKLEIKFPASTVPYLGILMNEKGWDGLYNIIIEPCTVCYDRPDLAKNYGQVSKVDGHGKYQWHLEIKI